MGGGALARAPLPAAAPRPALRPGPLFVCESPGAPRERQSLTRVLWEPHASAPRQGPQSSLVLGSGGRRGCDPPSLGPCAPGHTPHPQRPPGCTHHRRPPRSGAQACMHPRPSTQALPSESGRRAAQDAPQPPLDPRRGEARGSAPHSPLLSALPLAWGRPSAVARPSLATHTPQATRHSTRASPEAPGACRQQDCWPVPGTWGGTLHRTQGHPARRRGQGGML